MTVDENRAVALNVACNLRNQGDSADTVLVIASKIFAFLTAANPTTTQVVVPIPPLAPVLPVAPERKRGRPAKVTESTQPAATPAAPAEMAPSAEQPPAQSPAVSTSTPESPDPAILVKATEAVIRLANEFSREDAVTILDKRKVKRCSQLKPEDWQAVLDEAEEAIDKRQAAAASQSLV